MNFFLKNKNEIISYLICIGHEKQVITGSGSVSDENDPYHAYTVLILNKAMSCSFVHSFLKDLIFPRFEYAIHLGIKHGASTYNDLTLPYL